MRPIERIDNFVQKINWYKLFYDRWKKRQAYLPSHYIEAFNNVLNK